ncbi:hypothetical protein GCM10023147_24630 [Tsukamurella soli]|uniref:Uncharacterized protein n=1 Tax=Tsukamurella soli TaxID=644556 RepID=A0ABP8JNQ6_9ACTN
MIAPDSTRQRPAADADRQDPAAPDLAERAAPVRELMADAHLRHHRWITEHGVDLPEVQHRTTEGRTSPWSARTTSGGLNSCPPLRPQGTDRDEAPRAAWWFSVRSGPLRCG